MTADDLPEGWALTQLPAVFTLNPPKPKAAEYADDCPVTFVPMPAVDAESGTIKTPSVRKFAEVRKGFTFFRNDDVILAKITPCMENGKAAVARDLLNGLGFGSTEFHVMRSMGAMIPEFLFHFIRQESFRRAAEAEMTGSVGQKRVPAEYLKGVELPLPPQAEQQRIVVAVERILDRVNAARARLDRVPTTLKWFRQAVITAACSGQLTADWKVDDGDPDVRAELARTKLSVNEKDIRYLVRRATIGVPDIELPQLPESWVVMTVRELVEYGAIFDFQDGNHGSLYPRATDFGDVGVRFITALQVFDNDVRFEEAPFLGEEKAKQLRIGFVKPRDVLLTHNATVGRVAVMPSFEGEAVLGTSVTYYRVDPSVLLPEFLAYQMQADYWQSQLNSVMEQTTRNQVSVTKQVEFRLFLPPLAEQQEIVKRVSALFACADAIEAAVAAGRKRVDSLTQAVLAKAFRGELVPTEAELARRENRPYEPAADLLARVRASNETAPAKQAGRRKVTRPNDAVVDLLTFAALTATDAAPLNRTKAIKFAAVLQEHHDVVMVERFLQGQFGPYSPEIEAAEPECEKRGYFTVRKTPKEEGRFEVQFSPGPNAEAGRQAALNRLGEHVDAAEQLLRTIREMTTDEAELFATVYTVWNELLLAGKLADEKTIAAGVYGWHEEKRKFTPDAIRNRMTWMQEAGYVPKSSNRPTELPKPKPAGKRPR